MYRTYPAMLLIRSLNCRACLIFVSCCFILQACTPEKKDAGAGFTTDEEAIAKGAVTFQQSCSSCHTFEHDGIGPHLGGITAQVDAQWLSAFIKNPQAVIAAGDERAKRLFERYKVYMPSFSYLSDEEIDQLMAFMHTKKAPAIINTVGSAAALEDPIPAKIALSDLVMNLELITQIPPSSDKPPGTRIAKMDFPQGSGRMFILDLRGKLYEIANKKPVEYFDMAARFANFIHQPGLATGFGSFAFHPDFLENGLLYTSHTEAAGSAIADFAYADSIPVQMQWVVSEWKTTSPSKTPFTGEGRELFRVNMVTQMHGVQELTFNPLAKPGDEDYGLLYIGIGDGGGVETGYPFLAHSLEHIWGAIIRIDPAGRNSANGKYGIPASNPYASNKNPAILREIYAYGFRNPHRITWTRTGQMLATNIGHHNIESLNLIEAGNDYGWPIREGNFVLKHEESMDNLYPLPADDASYAITYPVAQYDHDDGNAICGGFEYWGSETPALEGKYVFGDIPRGKLFYVETGGLKQGSMAEIKEWQLAWQGKTVKLNELCGDNRVDLRFGRDPDGEMYIFFKPDGKVYRLVE